MFKILETCNFGGSSSDARLFDGSYKTKKEAVKDIILDLEDTQKSLNDDAKAHNDRYPKKKKEPYWYWKKQKYDFDTKYPWWTDGSLTLAVIPWSVG